MTTVSDLVSAHGVSGDVSFSEDIPSEEWVNQKLRYVAEDGFNEFGVPRFFGPVTGSFSRPLMLPVSLLASVPGARGEQTSPRNDSLDWIRSHVQAEKELPGGPPFITVDPYGKAWMSEGNHRVMISEEMNLSHIPVEVRYFSGGQRKASDFSPTALLALDAAFRLSDLPSISVAEKGIDRILP